MLLRSGATFGAVETGTIERERLCRRIGSAERVAWVVAPAGYGKTVAIEYWARHESRPVGWVSVDRAHGDRSSFWSRFVAAVRSVMPDLDDEVELALTEEPLGSLFLNILIASVARSSERAVVVVDDFDLIVDDRVLAELDGLVRAVGDRLGLVIAARSDRPLPLAAWRVSGWLVEVNEMHLRITADEAAFLAAPLGIGEDDARRINHLVEGWPIAFGLAVTSAARDASLFADSRELATSDHDLLDHLITHILDQLPVRARDGARMLSVVGSFDAEMAHELLGPDAGTVVDELQRCRLLTASERPGRTALRFHAAVRSMLERQLEWHHPSVHADLHRRASAVHRNRNELGEAFRHLQVIGDPRAAANLVLGPALHLVDIGDRAGLSRMLAELPPPSQVSDPLLALDLAQAAFFAGARTLAEAWCARAEQLDASDGGVVELKLQTTQAVLAMMNGELGAAEKHVDEFVRLERSVRSDGQLEQRFCTIAARLALVQRDVPAARVWVERARLIAAPPVMVEVGVPGLEAWLDMLVGRVESARQRITAALAWADQRGLRPHHSVFDAFVTAAWIAYRAGDIAKASELASKAMADAELLGYDWNLVRAGVISARVRLIADGPRASLAVVRETLAAVTNHRSPLAAQLDLVHARALTNLGLLGAARAAIVDIDDSSSCRIVRAAIELADGHREEVASLLDERDRWTPADRIEAQVLVAVTLDGTARLEAMAIALDEAAEIDLVAPFLEHGPAVEALILHPSLAPIHRRLTAMVRQRRETASADRRQPGLVEPLTARERTILELLPTHLSYSMIGEQLYVSVNTVKSNVKAIYRKLGVTTRAEAVAVARAASLI